jgi:hypothetical protein
MRAVVASREPQVTRRLAAGLDSLLVPYRVVEARAPVLPPEPQGTVYCLDSRMAAEVPRLMGPTIVVLSGAWISDETVARLRGGNLCTLRLADITPATLLRAVISATTHSDVGAVAERLQRLGRLRQVRAALITAFLEEPGRMNRLTDLRRALAPLSRESAQALVRASGFERAEHLFTALRCAAWALLTSEGVERRQVEEYLGILDRASFRRACRRAGVPTLHRGLSLDEFDNETPVTA